MKWKEKSAQCKGMEMGAGFGSVSPSTPFHDANIIVAAWQGWRAFEE